MPLLIFFGILVVANLYIAGMRWERGRSDRSRKHDNVFTFVFSVVGIFCLVIFSIMSTNFLKDGSPATSLPVGMYRVAFIDFVPYTHFLNVVIDGGMKNDKGIRRPRYFFYQFPRENFRKKIIENPDTLIITQSDDGNMKFNLVRLK